MAIRKEVILMTINYININNEDDNNDNKKAMMTGHSCLQKAIHEDFLNHFFPQRKLAVLKLT